MEWEWGLKHERYLWEQLEPRVMHPLPPAATFPGFMIRTADRNTTTTGGNDHARI